MSRAREARGGKARAHTRTQEQSPAVGRVVVVLVNRDEEHPVRVVKDVLRSRCVCARAWLPRGLRPPATHITAGPATSDAAHLGAVAVVHVPLRRTAHTSGARRTSLTEYPSRLCTLPAEQSGRSLTSTMATRLSPCSSSSAAAATATLLKMQNPRPSARSAWCPAQRRHHHHHHPHALKNSICARRRSSSCLHTIASEVAREVCWVELAPGGRVRA